MKPFFEMILIIARFLRKLISLFQKLGLKSQKLSSTLDEIKRLEEQNKQGKKKVEDEQNTEETQANRLPR